jgi:hypothetical protein
MPRSATWKSTVTLSEPTLRITGAAPGEYL